MSTITFDTLKFVKTLKSSGMSEDQAEAIANAVRDAQETQLVAKLDLVAHKIEMIKWIIALLVAQAGLVVALLKFFD
ncbi:CCDC90 family protein [Thiomicrospira microaerophila]|uniref:DUF1640 domain-containing protein n=1 Tax=Thiomicrospira microaerophila TaxID=406020 RepID=UPI0005C8547E|nr:DUF1640 domain-containing protein [Thiomicrospira microaerophila]